jgi:hypothetical protein
MISQKYLINQYIIFYDLYYVFINVLSGSIMVYPVTSEASHNTYTGSGILKTSRINFSALESHSRNILFSTIVYGVFRNF